MNSYDDPKTLRDGECTLLVNAMPGNPPTPRNGISGVLIEGTVGNAIVPPAVGYEFGTEKDIMFWIE
jgi:hypothetical protein